MPRPSLVITLLLLLALPCVFSRPGVAADPAAREFPWLSPFEDGTYIGELLPAGISEIDYESLLRHLGGKDIEAVVLNVSERGFATVCIGLYDEKRHDVQPLWHSSRREDLPFAIKNLAFDSIFIKYTYLPGDKYISCNFKVAVGLSYEREKPKMKVFRVAQDMDYAGVALMSGDFILAGDSGGGGALSYLGNNDYSDLVFVLRQKPEPPIPLRHVLFAIGACGLVTVSWWSFRRGKKGLTE